MKLLAYLLITASLIVGAISASTAYMADIGTTAAPKSDAALEGTVLSAAAGAYHPLGDFALVSRVKNLQAAENAYQAQQRAEVQLLPPPEEPVEVIHADEPPPLPTAPTGEALLAKRDELAAIGRPNDRVTPELLALLREQDVRYVRVRTFSAGRWFGEPGKYMGWIFVASTIGLLVGALVVRRAAKAEIRATLNAPDGRQTGAAAAFAQMNAVLDGLQRDLSVTREPRLRTAMIVERLGIIQREHTPSFVGDRAALIGALGLGGFAEVMDRFSAFERQINRAWSAAADEHEDEALTSLNRALAMMPEVAQALPQ